MIQHTPWWESVELSYQNITKMTSNILLRLLWYRRCIPHYWEREHLSRWELYKWTTRIAVQWTMITENVTMYSIMNLANFLNLYTWRIDHAESSYVITCAHKYEEEAPCEAFKRPWTELGNPEKIDLRNGYWHCVLDEETSYPTTFQTLWGRYGWLKLPFGPAVSCEIF